MLTLHQTVKWTVAETGPVRCKQEQVLRRAAEVVLFTSCSHLTGSL